MMQQLADNFLYILVLSTLSPERVDKCACVVFMPTPVSRPGRIRELTVNLQAVTIIESRVKWNGPGNDTIDIHITEGNPDTIPETMTGLPPAVPV